MNKPSRFPHSLVLIFAMVVVGQLLTYVLPKGEFATEPQPSAGAPYQEIAGKPPLRERLAAARKQRGLSERQLAALFVVDENTVKNWELGPVQEGEPWHPGTHIEAHVGALLERWIETGDPPTPEAIASWKNAVNARKRVVPGTYHHVESAEHLPWHATLTSIAHGFAAA
ncbi:MAG TPA: hypothetical protein ENI87_10355, partial [bacterium]|nr:hypothetical protein [bacterium]